MATQADVEHVKVLGAFRGETRPDGQGGHTTHGTEVKGQRAVGLCVGEGAVAVAQSVLLKEDAHQTRDGRSSVRVCRVSKSNHVMILLTQSLVTLLLILPGPQATQASWP